MKNLCYKFKNITCNISVISFVLIFHSHPVKRKIWEMIFQNTFGIIFNLLLKEALTLDCQWRERDHLLVIGSLYNCYFVKCSCEPMEGVIRPLIRSPVFLMRLQMRRCQSKQHFAHPLMFSSCQVFLSYDRIGTFLLAEWPCCYLTEPSC